MSNFVIDAYAWIEYFDGTLLGEKVKALIEDKRNIVYTNVLTIAELSGRFSKTNKNFDEAKKITTSLSAIYNITSDFAEEVGKLHVELKKERKHMGLVDAFVLLTARKLNAKVVTGDEDFRGLKEALMIK